jgi:hypothetical protein
MQKADFIAKIQNSIFAVSTDKADFTEKMNEVNTMLQNVAGVSFTSRGNAKTLTGLSYLAGIDSSSKIVKGQKLDYMTLVLYLAAADMSGFNLCPMATAGCKQACLVSSGRAKLVSAGQQINSITWARLKKTWLLMFNREFFMSWLNAEIYAAKNLAKDSGKNFAVRLNGTSDLSVGLFKINGLSLLSIHSDVQFYDYTKLRKQLDSAKQYDNYDVTFSYANTDEHNNIANAMYALSIGQKIAVVFDYSTFGGTFPATFLGYEVVNGDETDLTFLQEKQVLALNLKKVKTSQADNSFIVTKDMYEAMTAAM